MKFEGLKVLEVEHNTSPVAVQAVAEAIRGYLLLAHLLCGKG